MPDPLGPVSVGDAVRDVPGYSSRTHGIYSHGQGYCSVGINGYVCTRPSGHPPTWRHIGANTSTVVMVSGGEGSYDPFAHIHEGALATDHRNWDHTIWGIRGGDRENWCRETHEDHEPGAFCTRPLNHPGQHISTRGGSPHRVMWVKPVGQQREFIDPEDGSDADPEETVYTTTPETGTVVKLRDRLNRLYVLGPMLHSQNVEVLDLLRNELRNVPPSRCVRVDSPLTPEELTQVTRWYAGHRVVVREVAVREHRNGRWCASGLNDNLQALGLEPHEPTLRGEIHLVVPFECEDVRAGQSTIESLVRGALTAEVSTALRAALPTVNGLVLSPELLAASAHNFHRS